MRISGIEGNGYEARQTSKEQTEMPSFMLEGLLVCAHTLWLNDVTETFLLVSCLDWTQVKTYCVLCTAKAKKANKNVEMKMRRRKEHTYTYQFLG